MLLLLLLFTGFSSHTATLQVIDAANEIVDSIDRDELAKYLSHKSDPEDEEAEVCIFVC